MRFIFLIINFLSCQQLGIVGDLDLINTKFLNSVIPRRIFVLIIRVDYLIFLLI